jgi:hypothetical protein
MNLFTLALLVLTPLLVWRIYSRLKAMVVRQQSIMARHWTGLGAFSFFLFVIGSEVIKSPDQAMWLAVGSAGGIGYGIWGLRLTRLQDTDEGMFFTPNARLGILPAMLLAARILYIGFDIYVNQDSGAPMPRFTDSPLTVLVFGMCFAYYGTYSAGLLRWRWRAAQGPQ